MHNFVLGNMLAAVIALTLAGTASARTFENNVEWASVCHSNSAACTLERKSELQGQISSRTPENVAGKIHQSTGKNIGSHY